MVVVVNDKSLGLVFDHEYYSLSVKCDKTKVVVQANANEWKTVAMAVT